MTLELGQPDTWAHLRRHTAARIALGHSGGSLPTRAQLAFALDHALARDAVQAPFDADALADELRGFDANALALASDAPDRATYLRRPDLGRKLSDRSIQQLSALDRADPTDFRPWPRSVRQCRYCENCYRDCARRPSLSRRFAWCGTPGSR